MTCKTCEDTGRVPCPHLLRGGLCAADPDSGGSGAICTKGDDGGADINCTIPCPDCSRVPCPHGAECDDYDNPETWDGPPRPRPPEADRETCTVPDDSEHPDCEVCGDTMLTPSGMACPHCQGGDDGKLTTRQVVCHDAPPDFGWRARAEKAEAELSAIKDRIKELESHLALLQGDLSEPRASNLLNLFEMARERHRILPVYEAAVAYTKASEALRRDQNTKTAMDSSRAFSALCAAVEKAQAEEGEP